MPNNVVPWLENYCRKKPGCYPSMTVFLNLANWKRCGLRIPEPFKYKWKESSCYSYFFTYAIFYIYSIFLHRIYSILNVLQARGGINLCSSGCRGFLSFWKSWLLSVPLPFFKKLFFCGSAGGKMDWLVMFLISSHISRPTKVGFWGKGGWKLSEKKNTHVVWKCSQLWEGKEPLDDGECLLWLLFCISRPTVIGSPQVQYHDLFPITL